MKCYECAYWNVSPKRREFQSWGDCYRVLEQLSPEIKECVSDSGHQLQFPFDPHDAARFKFDSRFRKVCQHICSSLPKGVRVQREDGLLFFQTEQNFSCERGSL